MILKDLKLIAIHIEKTGGMSFKFVLKQQYHRKYYRMNIKPEVVDRHADLQRHLELIPADTQVIQGHFRYSDAIPLFQAYPQVPVITWLREPVQRVISQYYFFQRKFRDGEQPEKTYMEEYSLLDFARDERFQNSMTLALAGAEITKLAFVGLLEHLNEDMDDLAALLGWRKYQIPKQNTNIEYKSQFATPTEEEKAEIARLNQDDVALYQSALELRKKRQSIKT